MVLDYLVHYGYCNTAQLFASATGQLVEEEMASIRNRQREELLVPYRTVGNFRGSNFSWFGEPRRFCRFIFLWRIFSYTAKIQ